MGTGLDGNAIKYKDFYSFDPATGSWNKITPMPAAAATRYNAVAFSAAGKGYVGTGYDGANLLSDFWQFDPAVNTVTTTITGTAPNTVTTSVTTTGSWKRVADFPTPNGSGRQGAVAASVSDIGYVGCGFDGNNEKDFYRYDPASNTWAPLAVGLPRRQAHGGLGFRYQWPDVRGHGHQQRAPEYRFLVLQPGRQWGLDPEAQPAKPQQCQRARMTIVPWRAPTLPRSW
ncbi:MAG: hypothetical protein WKG07_42070 [Hymenobacter sp.]